MENNLTETPSFFSADTCKVTLSGSLPVLSYIHSFSVLSYILQLFNTLSSILFVTAFSFITPLKKKSFDKEENMNFLSFILRIVSWVCQYSK